MSKRAHTKSSLAALFILLMMISSSCTMVGKDHEVNAAWRFISYQGDSTVNYGTIVTLDIENSTKITGEGPIRNYRGGAEIWKDGTIQISNLCCGDTAEDSTLLPQLQFYDYLNSCTEYEVNGSLLVLRGANSEMRFEK